MAFDEIDDRKRICRDVSQVGRRGKGDVELTVASQDEIDYVMLLIKQSFDENIDESNGE
jgi:predicted transport protein